MKGQKVRTGYLPRAITLVELLAVMAILAILACLLIPALVKALGAARLLTCVNYERQIGVAILFYTDDARGSLPYHHGWDANMLRSWEDGPLRWDGQGLLILGGYAPEVTKPQQGIFFCPGREEHGNTNASSVYCDYVIGWGGAGDVPKSPTLAQFPKTCPKFYWDEYNVYHITDGSILLGDVRARSDRGPPQDIPHDANASLLLVDGSVKVFPDAFGGFMAASGTAPGLGDRNSITPHASSRNWWGRVEEALRK
ncbi:MAG: type II secretion system protein [Planctomycetes bacterium]|nr:type II secretion system protein [Planctomycetota bacterium]